MEEDLIELNELEVIQKNGKTYVKMSSLKPVDDTLPDEIKELIQ